MQAYAHHNIRFLFHFSFTCKFKQTSPQFTKIKLQVFFKGITHNFSEGNISVKHYLCRTCHVDMVVLLPPFDL